jgi:hypothetical protein
MSVLEANASVAVKLCDQLQTELKAIWQRLGTTLHGAHRPIQPDNVLVDGRRHYSGAPATEDRGRGEGVYFARDIGLALSVGRRGPL